MHGMQANKRFLTSFLLTALVLTTCSCFMYHPKRPLPTIAGPESDELLDQANGYLIYESNKDLVALSLPSLKSKTIWRYGQNRGFIISVSGPDESGWIAFVEDYYPKKEHALIALQMEKEEERRIFSRPCAVLWTDAISKIALSPKEGRIAFISNPLALKGKKFKWLYSGPLEIWDVHSGEGGATGIVAVDGGLSWFPDGKRLIYVSDRSGSDREQLPRRKSRGIPILKNLPLLGWLFTWPGDWRNEASPKTEALHYLKILDVETGETTFLCRGHRPIVSDDGSKVLVYQDGRYAMIDSETGNFIGAASWPGKWGRPIAFTEQDLLVYWGLPTEGQEQMYTKNNSPAVGPKAMRTIKLADLVSGEFRTLIGSIDPRDVVSYGEVEESFSLKDE